MFIDDKTRVSHMVEAAEEALSFIVERSVEDVRNDRKLALALVKCLEVVGEAGYKTSRNFRDSHPEIPWRELINLRNQLIHEYHDISHEQVWETLQTDIPSALPALRTLLQQLQRSSPESAPPVG